MSAVRSVGIDEGRRLRDAGHRLIDVREPFEWESGHIPGAAHIPLGEIPTRIAAEVPDRETPLLLYCRSGARSGRAATYLAGQGYTNVSNLDALIDDWHAAGGDWEDARGLLTAEQKRRYGRQVLLPEVGEEGQRRLLDARVLIIGVGGLGSPVALYLAAAGIGTIGLVDDDLVDESNLQRQVLHATDRLGMRKLDSAERTLRGLNPGVTVVKHPERLGADTAERLIADYDMVVDGTDNFDTRYALNDAAVRLRKPVIHGSVYRWEGQVTALVPFDGPCYRCIHPEPPPAPLAPDCDVAGVLGVLPGIVGMLQATEVLKRVLGVGEPLVGRLLMLDAKGTTFDEIRVARDPSCPSCGQPTTVEPVAVQQGR